jgi:hypothetical protein
MDLIIPRIQPPTMPPPGVRDYIRRRQQEERERWRHIRDPRLDPLLERRAAVSVNVAGSSTWTSASSKSATVTVGGGTNRVAVLGLAMFSNTATSFVLSNAASGGTLIAGADSGAANGARTLMWVVINPATGSQTFTVAWTTAMFATLGVIVFDNADQVTGCNNGTFRTGTSGAACDLAVTSVSGDMTTTVSVTQNVWASLTQTSRWLQPATLNTDTQSGGDTGPGTGTVTHRWTEQFSAQTVSLSGCNVMAGGEAVLGVSLGEPVIGSSSF